MFGISGAGYDMSTSIFSPDGRIFAAEYARKAVEQGATSIGILVDEGIVLLAEKRLEPLHEPESVEKVVKIDDHLGVATSGLMADARRLIQEARVKAQSYWLTFEEPIPAEALADHISEIKAQFTQGGGARPFGVAMIIGSVDLDGRPRLFVTDPTGALIGYLATVIGKGSMDAGEYMAKEYKRDMPLQKAKRLALDALRQVSDTKMSADNVEIAQITVSDRKFRKMTRDEIQQILSSGAPKT